MVNDVQIPFHGLGQGYLDYRALFDGPFNQQIRQYGYAQSFGHATDDGLGADALHDRMDGLLPALRQAGVGADCLKAVLTSRNRSWNALQLYGELLREHQAMNGR